MAIGSFLGAIAGPLVSGILGKKSGDKQAGISQRQYEQTRTDLAPYRQAGAGALSAYQSRLGLGGGQQSQPGQIGIGGYMQQQMGGGGFGGAPGGGGQPYATDLPQYTAADYTPGGDFEFNLEADQGYNFMRDQALEATTRQHAAQGGFSSGNVLAALGDRATGMASQYADQAFNRQFRQSRENYGRGLTDYGIRTDRAQTGFGIAAGQERDLYGREQDYLSRLQGLASSGQSAAVQTGGFGAQNVGRQIGAEQYGTGSINQALQGGMSNYLLSNYLNR